MNAIATIDFHGHQLITTEHNGVPHVAMKPIVENVGLDWKSQHRRIVKHPILNSTMVMMTTVAEDGKNREMMFLPIEYLNGWLFGVDVNRVRPEIRDTLLAYQRECFHVLNDYWNKGAAVNPRVTLTPEQKCHIQELVNNLAHQPGNSHASVYRALKSEFRVGSYSELLASDYPAACRFLGRSPLEGEYQPANKTQLPTVNGVSRNHLHIVTRYMERVDEIWLEMAPGLAKLGSPYVGRLHEYMHIGATIARTLRREHKIEMDAEEAFNRELHARTCGRQSIGDCF